MTASIKLYKSDGKNKNNEYPIKLTIRHGKLTPKRKTIGHSKLSGWNTKIEAPLHSHNDFDDLYPLIMEMRIKAQKSSFKRLESIDIAFALLLNEDYRSSSSNDFFSFANQLEQEMRDLGRFGNADAYKYASTQLSVFRPNLKFEEITTKFLHSFKLWKKSQGSKNSTIRTYIKEISAIYNQAVNRGVIENGHPFKGIFKDIPVRKRRARNRWLNKKNLKKLKKGTLSRNDYKRTRDLTMLQFYLGGMDLIDVYFMEKNKIQGKRLYTFRKKLGDKAYEYDVKIFPEAQKIIDKYFDDDKENKFVFPWRKDETGYKTFRTRHLRHLQEIQKLLNIKVLPLNDKISTKVIRHSFATIGKLKGIEGDIMREIMGHERNEIDTIYKDKYPEKIRDKAHFRIVKLKTKSRNK